MISDLKKKCTGSWLQLNLLKIMLNKFEGSKGMEDFFMGKNMRIAKDKEIDTGVIHLWAEVSSRSTRNARSSTKVCK